MSQSYQIIHIPGQSLLPPSPAFEHWIPFPSLAASSLSPPPRLPVWKTSHSSFKLCSEASSGKFALLCVQEDSTHSFSVADVLFCLGFGTISEPRAEFYYLHVLLCHNYLHTGLVPLWNLGSLMPGTIPLLTSAYPPSGTQCGPCLVSVCKSLTFGRHE